MKSISRANKILFSLLMFVFATGVAAAQQQFKIKGDPLRDSRFRPVLVSSPIPFDKSYEQLTAEQKELFRATYGGLAENEKPPFPKNGTMEIYEPLLKGHKAISRAGNLFLIAMIDEKGKVENVAVYESPAKSMTEYATTVIFNTEFEPATCAGEPCKMEFPFEIDLPVQEREKKGLLNN